MPRVSAEHLAARRSGILRAALRCFSRNGLHATSMKDICRAANLSPGAVYRYFASKEEMIEALAETVGERIHDSLVMAGDEEITADTLAELLAELCGALERPESVEVMRLDVVLWGEALRLPGVRRIYLRGRARLRRAVAEIVAAAQAQRDLDPGVDPHAVARAFIALFEGLVLQKLAEPELDLGPALSAARALFAGLRG